MGYDSTNDTYEHVGKVQINLGQMIEKIRERATRHDLSKLQSPEKEIFDMVTPKLKGLTYGGDEYKAALTEMGEALTHHYAHNSHHPEHYPNGVDGMDLLDLLEMFCDWKGASQRHSDGDFAKSLEINRKRFTISEQLASVLENTRKAMEW